MSSNPAHNMPKRVVVVLGMHRSGTSLLAQILHRLGVGLGNDLLVGPAKDNKYGYWENREIAMIQDFLLAELGRMWHEPRGVLPLPSRWLESQPARVAVQRLSDIVANELATNTGPLWGFKDPRTLRFLPMWQEIFTALQVQPTYILAVRRPQSVAGSLAVRNRMPADQAAFLWVQHNLELFQPARPPAAAIIDYDAWFDRPDMNVRRILQATGIQLDAGAALVSANAVLDKAERHHQTPNQTTISMSDRVYRLLTDPMPRAVRSYQLQKIAKRLDRATNLLRSWQQIIEDIHPAGPLPFTAWTTPRSS